MASKTVLPSVTTANAARLVELPFDDTQDFDDARRGFIGRLEPCVIRDAEGRVVWDNESYRAFLDGPAPRAPTPASGANHG